ncbi:Ig-like domain-containing protein [Novosphingobium sp.]|uniref:Ig-like domain-containing protein n=1 Tax=Novosphingobium sp. TaxID=1874826 RepID=UPI003B51A1CF
MTKTQTPNAPLLVTGFDTGVSAADNVTNTNAPQITGTAVPGALVTLYDTDGMTVLGTATADAASGGYVISITGTTLATISNNLDDGVHLLTVTAAAPGSDASNPSTPLVLTIDTQAPDAPTAPTLAAADDTGASAIDGITSASVLTFTGQSEPGATVRLLDGTTIAGMAMVAADGSYSITAASLAAGDHSFTVIATDLAGNVGMASGATAITIDTTAPPAPAAPTLAPGSDTGALRTDGLTADTTPIVTGTAEAGATVLLTDTDGTVLGHAVAAADGSYAIQSGTLLPGAHELTVTATDAAGNVSAPSQALNVLIDTAEATAAITAPASLASVGTFTFTITFDQAIVDRRGITPDDFKLITTGTAYGDIVSVSGSGRTGYITVGGLGGSGTIGLALADDTQITDQAGKTFDITTSQLHAVDNTTAASVEPVSAGPGGAVGTGEDPSPSAGGRYVAFDTTFDSTTGTTNVWVKDVKTGGLTEISTGIDGVANGNSFLPSISANGQAITFASDATNLIGNLPGLSGTNIYAATLSPADPASGDSVIVGPVQLVSAGNGSYGSEETTSYGGGTGVAPVVSGDGSTVVFVSPQSLTAGAEAGLPNVYREDLATGDLLLVSAGTAGTRLIDDPTFQGTVTIGSGTDDESGDPSVSSNGLVIAYDAFATNLGAPTVANEKTGTFYTRSYVYDVTTGVTTCLDANALQIDGIVGDVAPATATTQSSAYGNYLSTSGPVLSGDGTKVIYVAGNGFATAPVNGIAPNSFVVLETDLSTHVTTEISPVMTNLPGVSISGDGGLALYSDADGEIALYNKASNTTTVLSGDFSDFPVLAANGNAVVFAPDAGSISDVFEAQLGVSVSIAAVGDEDEINAAAMAAITKAGTLAFTGHTNAAPGSMVTLQLGAAGGSPGTIVTGTVGAGGVWTVAAPASDLDENGEYRVAVVIAAPGGDSTRVVRSFDLDTIAPDTPDAPVLDAGSDTGPAHDGTLTDTDTPTVTGKAEAGSTVTLVDQGGLTPGLVLGTGIADGNGVYAITVAGIGLTQGSHALAVTATDDAGNVSAASAALALTVDTIVPDAPQAPAMVAQTTPDPAGGAPKVTNGSVADPSGDGIITQSTTPILSGVALPGATVTLYDSDGIAVLGTAVADGKGAWTITSSTLTDGLHVLTVTQTKAAGDVSPVSAKLDLTVDTLPPLSPVITSLGGPLTVDAEHTSQVDVIGTAEPNSTVQLHVDMNNLVSGTAIADAEGDYEIDALVAAGVHKLTVIATDAAGNASQPSPVTLVTVDVPGAPSLIGVVSDDEIANANVFADANGNGVLDPGEATARTNSDGQFTFAGESGTLYASGGKDSASGLTLPGSLVAPAGSTAITPLTTLLAAYMQVSGESVADAEQLYGPLREKLGVSFVGVTSLDPAATVRAMQGYSADGPPNAISQEALSAQLTDTATLFADTIASAKGSAPAAFGYTFNTLAKILAMQNTPYISLTDTSMLSSLFGQVAAAALPNVTIDPSVISTVIQVVAAGNAAIASETGNAPNSTVPADDPQTIVRVVDSIESVEQGAAATALATVVQDPALAASTTQDFTGPALEAAVAKAAVVVIAQIALAPGSDGGFSGRDQITNDDTPVIIGTTIPGGTVSLVLNGPDIGQTTAQVTVLATTTADAAGHFSFVSPALPTAASGGDKDDQLEAVVSGINGSLPPVNNTEVPLSDKTLNVYVETPLTVIDPAPVIENVSDAPGPGSDADHVRLDVLVQATSQGKIDVYMDGGSTPIGTAFVYPSLYQTYDVAIETSAVAPGHHSFTLVETAPGGTVVSQDTAPDVTTVVPEAMTPGVAYALGPLSGATVSEVIAVPGNSYEAAQTTDASGHYTFPTNGSTVFGGGDETVQGGYDTASGLAFGAPISFDESSSVRAASFYTLPLSAPLGSSVITALTTLVQDDTHPTGSDGPGEALQRAEANVLAALGLPSTLDLLSLNPLEAAQNGDTAAFITVAKLLQLQELVFAGGVGIYAGHVPDIFSAAAQYLNQHGSLDLDNAADMQAVVSATFASAAVATPLYLQNLGTLVAAENAALDVRVAKDADASETISDILAISEVLQTKEAPALAAIINSPGGTDDTAADLTAIQQAYTGSNLDALVAARLDKVIAVASFEPSGDATTTAPVVHYTLRFTGAVSGLPASAFKVIAGSGLLDTAIIGVTPVAGSGGAAYDVAVSTGVGKGTLGLTFDGTGLTNPDGSPLQSGLFQPTRGYEVSTASATYNGSLATGDFNGDGKPDVVLGDNNTVGLSGFTLFLNKGDGTFAAQPIVAEGDTGTLDLGVGDFNGDGKLDVVTAGIGNGDVAVLPGNGDGTFAQPIYSATGNPAYALAVGDIDGDGKLDVVTANNYTNTVSVLLGRGDGTFTVAPTLTCGNGPISVALADLNGDGHLDIVTANSGDSTLSVFLGKGDGTFAAPVSIATAAGGDPQNVVLGDINGDGIPDIMVADESPGAIDVLLGNGDGTFRAGTPFVLATGLQDEIVSGRSPGVRSLALGDLNGDGKPDLLVGLSDGGAVGNDLILIGDGNGGFAYGGRSVDNSNVDSSAIAVTPDVMGSHPFAIADFNGDGREDYATGFADGRRGLLVDTATPQTVQAAPSGSVTIDRSPVAQPVLSLASGTGTLLKTGSTYTLDLGTVAQGASLSALQFAIANAASAPSDALDGTFGAASGDGFVVSGAALPAVLDAGESYAGLSFTPDTSTPGVHAETLTFAPRDQSATTTTYSAIAGTDASVATTTSVDGADVAAQLPAITLVVTEDVMAGAAPPPAAPTVFSVATSGTGVTNGAGDLGAGHVVTFTIDTTAPVTVAGGILDLALDDGGTAVYTGGSGTSALTFSTTIAAGQASLDLAITGIALNGATVQDANGSNADLSGAVTNPPGILVVATAAPVTTPVRLAVNENSGPAPIGIAIPVDPAYSADRLTTTLTGLPGDGVVALADGTVAHVGETLTTAQLAGLTFSAAAGLSSQSSTLTYTVTDPAQNAATGNATLAIGAALPPAITGTLGGQATSDAASIDPFASVTVADPGAGQTETVTVTPATTANGILSDPNAATDGGTIAGNGVYSVTGSAAQVTAALQDLIFTPTAHQVAAGTSVMTGFTIAVADSAGQQTRDAVTTVVATAADDVPLIGGTQAGQATGDLQPLHPFADATLMDPDFGAMATVTITLTAAGGAPTDADGVLSGNGLTRLGTGLYALAAATVAAAQSALQKLLFTPTAHQVAPGQAVTTGMTLAVSDGIGSRSDATTTVVATAIDSGPAITEPAQATTDLQPLRPFTSVAVSDPDFDAMEMTTITLSAGGVPTDANGMLTGTGLTKAGTGLYQLAAATPAATQAALQALVFTPTAHQVSPGQTVTTSFDVVVADGLSGAAETTTSVVATAVADVPVIAGTTAQSIPAQQTVNPFSQVTIADPDPAVTETATITLTAAGIASDADGMLAGAGLTRTSTGTYLLSAGSADAEQALLRALVFTPTTIASATTFTLQVANEVASASNAGTVVTVTPAGGGQPITAPPVVPTVTLALAGDTGRSATDGITSSAALFGTADPGDIITITAGATLLGSVTADAAGAFRFLPILADGTYALSASDTNVAGTGSATLSFTLDTTSPVVSAPSITVAKNAGATAIGIKVSDALSTASQLAVIIDALPDDGTVTLGGIAITSGQALTIAQLTGLMFTPTAGLSTASSTLAYSVTDPAGNKTSASATLIVSTPCSGGHGDVHMTTFDGLNYNFQATGDFVIAQARTAGADDGFEVQMHADEYQKNPGTSVATELAARVGTDVIQFSTTSRDATIDGVALTGTNPVQLADGTVRRVGQGWEVDWQTGESLTVTSEGYCLDFVVTPGAQDTPGSLQGLLGSGTGQSNDFQLPDGTVLHQPLSATTLLDQFADAWRVGAGRSLLDSNPAEAGSALQHAFDAISTRDSGSGALALAAFADQWPTGLSEPSPLGGTNKIFH